MPPISAGLRTPSVLAIRQLVGAPHEHPLHLGPLDEASATELFLATAARGGRDLGAELEAVRHIVAQLDGLPLAVELTATRAAEGPLEVIRDALGNAPGETLRGAFEGSWRLLGDAERHALIACTVFVGGFTVAAAEAVVPGPGVLRSLRTLHAHSLLTAETDRFHTPRLAMLEVIRQLATERGSEAAMTAARSAHAAYYASLGRPFQGFYPRRPAAYEACVADIPNAAAAARFAAGRDPAAVIGAVHYASTTAQIGENLSEELDELAACAARDQGDLDAELTTRIGETSFLLVRGQPAAAVEHARSLVARARAASPQTLRGTLRNLGFLFFAMDDGETAASVFDEMLACDVGPGGPPDFGTSAAAKNLARLGRVDEADRLLQAYDAAIWTDTIQRSWVARVRVVLATARGHIGQAIGHAEDALDVQRRAGAWCDAAGSAGKLCWLWFVRGAPDRAARYGADGVACADRGVPPWIAAQAQAVALLAVEPDGVAEALGGLPSLIAEVKARVGRRSLGALHALLLAWAGDTDRAAAALPPDDLPELSYLRALAATGVTAARGEAADVPPASEDRTLEERVARVWLRRILAQDTPRAHGAQSRR